jgi:hypothetical protein
MHLHTKSAVLVATGQRRKEGYQQVEAEKVQVGVAMMLLLHQLANQQQEVERGLIS